MKTLLLLALTTLTLWAEEVTLEWNPNPESDVVAYKLWTQDAEGDWDLNKQVATTTAKVEQAVGVWTTYAVTAVNSGGLESGWSVPLTFQLGPDGTPIFKTPSAPTGLRVRVTVEIEPTP
jgi:hypothetical protein